MDFSKGTAVFIYQLIVCVVLTCAMLAMYWPCYENSVHERVMGKAARNRVRSRQGQGPPAATNTGRVRDSGRGRMQSRNKGNRDI